MCELIKLIYLLVTSCFILIGWFQFSLFANYLIHIFFLNSVSFPCFCLAWICFYFAYMMLVCSTLGTLLTYDCDKRKISGILMFTALELLLWHWGEWKWYGGSSVHWQRDATSSHLCHSCCQQMDTMHFPSNNRTHTLVKPSCYIRNVSKCHATPRSRHLLILMFILYTLLV